MDGEYAWLALAFPPACAFPVPSPRQPPSPGWRRPGGPDGAPRRPQRPSCAGGSRGRGPAATSELAAPSPGSSGPPRRRSLARARAAAGAGVLASRRPVARPARGHATRPCPLSSSSPPPGMRLGRLWRRWRPKSTPPPAKGVVDPQAPLGPWARALQSGAVGVQHPFPVLSHRPGDTGGRWLWVCPHTHVPKDELPALRSGSAASCLVDPALSFINRS